jgi:hypothetical protein
VAKQSRSKGKSEGTRSIKSGGTPILTDIGGSGTNHSGAQDVIAGRRSPIATSGDFLPVNKPLGR